MSEFADFHERLERDDLVDAKTFGRICERLLSESIIVSGDSQTETELYDAAVHVQRDLAEYFAVCRLQLVHHENRRYFRLYPPQGASPTAPQDADLHREDSGMFRRSVGPGVGALLYCLRVLFTQGVVDGRIQAGDVPTDLGQIHITLKNKLDRDPMPVSQRQAAFRELARFWRVVRYDASASLDDPATPILIRSIVCDVVSQERAQAMLDALATVKAENGTEAAEEEA